MAVSYFDAAVLPMTKKLGRFEATGGVLPILRTLECCTISVDEAELVLWKKSLPALVEPVVGRGSTDRSVNTREKAQGSPSHWTPAPSCSAVAEKEWCAGRFC